MDGESLIERTAAGDMAALGELYDAHHARVRRLARQLTGDAQAAEDLVHEVFVGLPRALRRFRGDASFVTFLLAMTAHRAKNHVRAAVRRRRALTSAAEQPRSGGHAASPEQLVADRELLSALNRALDALPLAQRLAFVLCEVEGLSNEEAAKIAGAPPGTLRSRLHHARRKLRELLSGGGGA